MRLLVVHRRPRSRLRCMDCSDSGTPSRIVLFVNPSMGADAEKIHLARVRLSVQLGLRIDVSERADDPTVAGRLARSPDRIHAMPENIRSECQVAPGGAVVGADNAGQLLPIVHGRSAI